MTQREEFEKWAEPAGLLLGRLVGDYRYESLATEYAFRGWQASRAVALEDAAVKCDEWSHHLTQYDAAKSATAETCAELVRELKGQE